MARVEPHLHGHDYELPLRIRREGPVPLLDPPPGLPERKSLRIAMLVPPFKRGSGGHNTLFQIFSRLEARGHACSVWMHDYSPYRVTWPAVRRHEIREFFAPIQGPVYDDFDAWHGTDVIMATGWQTAHRALSLPGAYARVYIVNDHEPDFFAPSIEQLIAADTYRHGMHCIAASPWLRDVLIERYGGSADAFQLGVDHQVYYPRRIGRRRDTIVYYARHATPRRAVPIGLMALGELHRRRPHLRIVLFGTEKPAWTTFPYEHAGILSPEELAWLYSHATVGLCLSLTNFSLMPKEMLACGLPCVELAGVSAESIFGEGGPIELADLDPVHLADAVERLLDDEVHWEQRSRAGIEFVASHTWDHATTEVEQGIRHALRLHELAPEPVR
jgi:glycosyltransferase involved in cell wall biosynthesis